MIPNNYFNRIFKKVILRLKNRNLKRVIGKFAEKSGLIYFGYVDQHSDDHKVVRGLTVSSTHQDDHYSLGSVGGYNVTIVSRSDYVWQPDASSKLYNWLIISIDLHTEKPIPHFFIGAKNHDLRQFDALFSTFPNMKELDLGTFEKYDQEFTSRFSIYGRPAKSNDIQRIITAEVAKVLGVHFWPFSAEQHDNVLYLYSTNLKINSSLLETILENGLWLAGHLDSQVETTLNQD